MAEDLLTQRTLQKVIGQSRLRRLCAAGWLLPVKRSPGEVLFAPRDVHAALRRLERQACPPDRIEVLRVRASELRNGHPRVRKERRQPPRLDEIQFDFSAL